MGKTITGAFPTRRQVELAVEHLVQEYGVERTDIFIEPKSDENSAGVSRAGADAQHATVAARTETGPDLNGPLLVSVALNQDETEAVEKAFRDAGAMDIVKRRAERPPVAPLMRATFKGAFVLNSDYDDRKGQEALDAGRADAISYGRPFISNPDLPRRFGQGLALAPDDITTWYSQGTAGYLDYPPAD
jgi:hypothetical protein